MSWLIFAVYVVLLLGVWWLAAKLAKRTNFHIRPEEPTFSESMNIVFYFLVIMGFLYGFGRLTGVLDE